MDDDTPRQLHPGDQVLEDFGTWAIIESRDGDRYVSHTGRPAGGPPYIEYDVEFERLDENWERQLDGKSWMSDASKADLSRALTKARAMVRR